MKNYFKNLRNWFHVIGGMILGYGITLLFGFPNRENFPLNWDDLRNLWTAGIGSVAVLILSLIWELQQDKVTKNESGTQDITVSGISAFLGGLICLFAPNVYVAVILNAICLVLIYKDYQKWRLR